MRPRARSPRCARVRPRLHPRRSLRRRVSETPVPAGRLRPPAPGRLSPEPLPATERLRALVTAIWPPLRPLAATVPGMVAALSAIRSQRPSDVDDAAVAAVEHDFAGPHP